MSFCIPKKLAKQLKQAAKSGEIKINELYDMTSGQRNEFFSNYVDGDTANKINAGFERAMLSEQQTAMSNWAKQVFIGKEKGRRKNVLDKIDKLSDKGLLDPSSRSAFMEDLVGESLGVKVTAEEAQKIDSLSEKLRTEEAKGLDGFGVPKVGYWKARLELDNYLLSITPSSRVKITTSTIRRGLMLASIKSPLVNITGNTLLAFEQSLERRIKSGVSKGSVNQKLLKEYRKTAVDIFGKTGFDITRMQDIGEGRKTLGENITHSQGDGVVRKMGRVMEDTVFKQMLGKPDVWFAAMAQADSANLKATEQAKEEGFKGKALEKRATELFKDAMSISPTSDMGNRIRTNSIADAEFSTFTNDGGFAKASLKARDYLNAIQEDIAIGDQTIPFAKTPANAIQFSFDSAGISAARGIKNFPAAVRQYRRGDPSLLRDSYSDMFRSGFGIMGAILLANLFDPDDFIGMYPSSKKQRELLKLKGATPNSIKIGDKYYSLDYFGGFRGSLVGIMNAKKYGGNVTESLYNFARGNLAQLADMPGVEEVGEAYEFIQEAAPGGRLSQDELVRRTKTLTSDYSRSLVIPAILKDVAKAFDESERQVDWKNPADRWKADIPGLRQTLPEKLDVFGNVLKGEPAYSVMLFGARVKTAKDNAIVNELKELDKSDNLPSLTRPEYTSSRVKGLKEQVGDKKFKEAMTYFRSKYKEDTIRLIDSSRFKKMEDDEKRKAIDKIKNSSLDRMLKRYRYKKPRK
ncbi:MAG: hypothetical protein ACTSQE_07400 [Candidatus Heimdallarchaeaceae archaeon]